MEKTWWRRGPKEEFKYFNQNMCVESNKISYDLPISKIRKSLSQIKIRSQTTATLSWTKILENSEIRKVVGRERSGPKKVGTPSTGHGHTWYTRNIISVHTTSVDLPVVFTLLLLCWSDLFLKHWKIGKYLLEQTRLKRTHVLNVLSQYFVPSKSIWTKACHLTFLS